MIDGKLIKQGNFRDIDDALEFIQEVPEYLTVDRKSYELAIEKIRSDYLDLAAEIRRLKAPTRFGTKFE